MNNGRFRLAPPAVTAAVLVTSLTLADAMATTGPVLVEQTAAVFPTAADAENLFDTQKRQWQSCKDTKSVADPAIPAINVRVLGTPQGVKEYVLGAVDAQSSGSRKRITISMASNGGVSIPIACQQAMGVQGNLVVEARTCTRPLLPDPGPPAGTAQFPPEQEPNPAWAVPNAQRLVDAMLEKAG